MSKLVDRAVNALIRPPRKKYDESAIPLILQGDDSDEYVRLPLDFINKRNVQIVGSYYYNVNMDPHGGGPCVLYLHGNASSQLEGQFLVPNLCKYGIFVYCFDFAGCGCSGGQYVSLGYYEKYDTEFIIDELHTQFNLGPFILWGRSMGAATSLLVNHPLVVGRISDSAFTSIPDMCSAIAISYHLPPIFIPLSIFILKQRVIHQAKFNIEDVSPISVKYKKVVPVIFGHAKNDQFIPFDQGLQLFKHYPCKDKKLEILKGGHNSRRERSWIELCVTFIFNTFKIKVENPKFSTTRNLQEGVSHFSSFDAMLAEQDNENMAKRNKRHHRKQKTSFSSYNSHYEYNSKNRHWQHHKHYKFRQKDFLSKNFRSQKSKFDYKIISLNSKNDNTQNNQNPSDSNSPIINLQDNQKSSKSESQYMQKENSLNDIKAKKESRQNDQNKNMHNSNSKNDKKENSQNDSKTQKENNKNNDKINQSNSTESIKNKKIEMKKNKSDENQLNDNQHIKHSKNNEVHVDQNSHQNQDENKEKNSSKEHHHKMPDNNEMKDHKHNYHHHTEANEGNKSDHHKKENPQTQNNKNEVENNVKGQNKNNSHHHKHNQHPHVSNDTNDNKDENHKKIKSNENNN